MRAMFALKLQTPIKKTLTETARGMHVIPAWMTKPIAVTMVVVPVDRMATAMGLSILRTIVSLSQTRTKPILTTTVKVMRVTTPTTTVSWMT